LRDQVRKLEDQLRASSTFEVGAVETPVKDIPLEVTPTAKPQETVARGRWADEDPTTVPTPDLPVSDGLFGDLFGCGRHVEQIVHANVEAPQIQLRLAPKVVNQHSASHSHVEQIVNANVEESQIQLGLVPKVVNQHSASHSQAEHIVEATVPEDAKIVNQDRVSHSQVAHVSVPERVTDIEGAKKVPMAGQTLQDNHHHAKTRWRNTHDSDSEEATEAGAVNSLKSKPKMLSKISSKGSGGGGGGPLDKWIKDNNLDEKCGNVLRGLSSTIQKAVQEMGGCADCRNPSAAVMSRIRKIERWRADEKVAEEPAAEEDVAEESADHSRADEQNDWICPNCADHQFSRHKHCRQCSTPKNTATQVQTQGGYVEAETRQGVGQGQEADLQEEADETWPDENDHYENDWADYEGRDGEAQHEDRDSEPQHYEDDEAYTAWQDSRDEQQQWWWR